MTEQTQRTEPAARPPEAGEDDDAAGRDGLALSTAPLSEEEREPVAGAGSFGGVRRPGFAGALAWTGREAAGWARWTWRQLTSMRVALILLFLLALATVPGSLVPQADRSPVEVAEFRADHETLAGIYDRLQLFEVYTSVWFSAIYILLFVSLIGCIVPRSGQFLGQLRGRPPRAPRRLDRMPASTGWHTTAAPEEALDAAERLLRKRRFRVARAADSVAAEKGYLREAGNLVFHIALVVLLIAFAVGQLYRSEGGKLVVVGGGFTNTLTQYDDFTSGTLFDVDGLERFTFDLDDFHADFVQEGPDIGTPKDFRAEVTYWRDGDEEGTEASVSVNHPLVIGSAKIYLLGHGYAPRITVTDGQGDVAFAGPVPFIPQDGALTSTGVVKVPDYSDAAGERDQLGFQGLFSPTFALTADRGPHSTFPDPDFPVLTLTAYRGNLGLDSGLPQNVYQLDTRGMEQLRDADGEPLRVNLLPGEEWELPDGRGTLAFEGYDRWATFQITTPAANGWALAGAVAAVLGLAASLLIQRRRVWLRATAAGDGTTRVEMASLGRVESARIPEELAALAAELHDTALPPAGDAAGSGSAPDSGGDGRTAGSGSARVPEPAAASEPAPVPERAESADDSEVKVKE